MLAFLTSSPATEDFSALNPANGFVDALHAAVPPQANALFICADPDSYGETDYFAASVFSLLKAANITISSTAVLDARREAEAPALVRQAALIILAGGHVPTQNAFFEKIGLRELLASFDGTVLGISAGTMNSARTVYAQPELPGEAVSTTYRRFLPGLGLTEFNVIPHYQAIRDTVLDGMALFEEITYPDSFGHPFYALVDGSYLLCSTGRTELHGEAYRILDGTIQKICEKNDMCLL